jgi:cytochrome P450
VIALHNNILTNIKSQLIFYVISFSNHSLPYTEAALMEAQRLSNITPLAVAHKALRDTQLQGYSIPRVHNKLGFIFINQRVFFIK